MAKELVEYSARLQAAVDKILINPAFSVQGGRRIRGRSTLTEQVGGRAAETVLCRVDGGNAESGFNVTLYGNGKDQPKTGTGILFVPELALGSTIPAGSWILGHRSVMQITGGGEE